MNDGQPLSTTRTTTRRKLRKLGARGSKAKSSTRLPRLVFLSLDSYFLCFLGFCICFLSIAALVCIFICWYFHFSGNVKSTVRLSDHRSYHSRWLNDHTGKIELTMLHHIYSVSRIKGSFFEILSALRTYLSQTGASCISYLEVVYNLVFAHLSVSWRPRIASSSLHSNHVLDELHTSAQLHQLWKEELTVCAPGK